MSLFQHKPHPHKPQNINDLYQAEMTIGDRIADFVANTMGSWPFIIGQSAVIVCWCALNVVGWIANWDPYPFILLNLLFSTQAAYSAPIIMMSQNRQSAKDRLMAEHDFEVNQKSYHDIEQVLKHLEAQDSELLKQTNELQKQTEMLIALIERNEKRARATKSASSQEK